MNRIKKAISLQADMLALFVKINAAQENIDLLNLAVNALREKAERENPQPLTVEELREMAERCEPIYITRIDDETPIFRGNKIVGGVLDKAAVMNVADHLPFMAIYGRNLTLAESDYGKTWLAYRTKPTGGKDHE